MSDAVDPGHLPGMASGTTRTGTRPRDDDAVLPTGQRVGAAAGIAFTGSTFYGALSTGHGDYALAYRHGVVVIGGFVLAALVLAGVDTVVGRRGAGQDVAPAPS